MCTRECVNVSFRDEFYRTTSRVDAQGQVFAEGRFFFRKPSSDACPDRSTARGMELSVVGRKYVVEMVAGKEGRNVFSIN